MSVDPIVEASRAAEALDYWVKDALKQLRRLSAEHAEMSDVDRHKMILSAWASIYSANGRLSAVKAWIGKLGKGDVA